MRFALVACLVIACKSGDSTRSQSPPSQAKTQVPPTPVKTEDPCRNAKQEGALAWIADDYPSAIECARQRKVPLVVDLWAPWCHTCLSMQSTVFQDASFAKDKNKFVFASLDTDRESNAPALAKLAISAWPTFYVIDGSDEKVLARWVGAATVEEFQNFLESGALALVGGQAASEAHMLSASRALAVKDYATADTELTAALKTGPDAWLRRGEALDALILTKWKKGDVDGCMAVADEYMMTTGLTAVASDFNVTAMSCADARAKDEPDKVKALREKAVTRWKALLADAHADLSIDDRSDAMASLRETLDALGKKAEAKQIAEQQKKLLDDAAAKAANPRAAMTYNWPRAEVYAYLGKPLELVPALDKSANDLPQEYDPRARLGWIYLKAGKLADAAKWTNDALGMVYGPRKARVLGQRADIAAAAGDKAAEKTYREQVVKLWESLPAAQQSPEALAKAKAALEATESGATGSATGSAAQKKK
ncbi:MAG: thioredoxin family protein [Acidobacteriota bacterium]